VQSGIDSHPGRTDTEAVRAATNFNSENFLPETYHLTQPLSPHRAAELDDVIIEPQKILTDYRTYINGSRAPLLIETPGGLLVPLTRELLFVDFMVQMQAIAPAPLILVARTGLGTINHTLLSLEAIRARDLPLAGIIFSGPENPDNIQTILDFSGTENLGHLVWHKNP
jgi:dethiobiotin synthetase